MEQLTDLLKNFGQESQENRRDSLDIGGESATSHRKVSDLSSNYSRSQRTDHHMETSGEINSYSMNNDLGHETGEFFAENSDIMPHRFNQTSSDNNVVHESSKVNHGVDISVSNSEVRYGKTPPSSKPVDDQRSFSPKMLDGAIDSPSRNLETPFEVRQNGGRGIDRVSDLKPMETVYRTKDQSQDHTVVESKKISKFKETLAIFKANASKSEDKQKPDSSSVETRASIKMPNKTLQGSQPNTAKALEPSQKDVELPAAANDNRSNNLSSDSRIAPVPAQSLSPKHAGKKRSFFQVVIPKIINTDHILSSRKSKKSVELREREYETMLGADAGATAGIHGNEAPQKSAASEDFPKESPVPDNSANRSYHHMDSKHEESYVVDPDFAQQEVATVTNRITEKRLFNDSDLVGISPKPEAQILYSRSGYNNRYLKYNDGNADCNKTTEANSSNSDGFGDVDVERSVETGIVKEGHSRTPSPQKITAKILSPASIAGKYSVDGEARDINKDMVSNFIPNAPSKPVVTSSTDKLHDVRQSLRVTHDESDSFSQSGSAFSEHSQKVKSVEPPPRNNPNVYKSSELYRPKTDTQKSNMARSYPLDEANRAGRMKPSSPQFHGNTLSRWTNAVDFSKSTRQMCQQCGTVTVEKPRKFCRKCQSDYL